MIIKGLSGGAVEVRENSVRIITQGILKKSRVDVQLSDLFDIQYEKATISAYGFIRFFFFQGSHIIKEEATVKFGVSQNKHFLVLKELLAKKLANQSADFAQHQFVSSPAARSSRNPLKNPIFDTICGAIGLLYFLSWMHEKPKTETPHYASIPAVSQPVAVSGENINHAQPTPARNNNPAVPAAEATLIAIVKQAKDNAAAAANDMIKGGIRAKRRRAICQSQAMRVSNWVGEIGELSSNSDGKGILYIKLDDNITIGTTNNAVSDALSSVRTLINPESPLFAKASAMKQGDKVVFSGTFFSSDVDCLEELSMTLDGSLQAPFFMFKFDDIMEASAFHPANHVSLPVRKARQTALPAEPVNSPPAKIEWRTIHIDGSKGTDRQLPGCNPNSPFLNCSAAQPSSNKRAEPSFVFSD